jgi:hypothetical protein
MPRPDMLSILNGLVGVPLLCESLSVCGVINGEAEQVGARKEPTRATGHRRSTTHPAACVHTVKPVS